MYDLNNKKLETEKDNVILIFSFWSEETNDNALLNLGRIIVNIVDDMMDVGFKRNIREELVKYRNYILKQVTMN